MEELKTEVIRERNSGSRKGFWYSQELGGYIPAKGKPLTNAAIKKKRVNLTILIVAGIAGLLFIIFWDKLKTLWTEKFKEVLSL